MISERYLEAIKKFEGFTPRATPDYGQLSNGYGTKARYEGEVIDRFEAERRFRTEIEAAARLVENFAPNLPDGAKAALTSLTYNAGTKWMSAGLGESVKRGDIDAASSIITEYNKAGGKVLPGLEARRRHEALWMHQTLNPPPVGESRAAGSALTPPNSVHQQYANSPSSAKFVAESGQTVKTEEALAIRFSVVRLLAQSLCNVHPASEDRDEDVRQHRNPPGV